jgi:hypothetical protein
VTSQGSPYVRFRRALDTGNATIALAAAAELDFVSLPDALELVLLLVHSRAPMLASRKPRPCSRVSPAWRAGDRKAAACALAELVHRRGLERASEALIRWAG